MSTLSKMLSSSAISRADYDTETNDLTIVFDGGEEYSYSDVPQDVYEGLIKAPSAGQFFHSRIKNVF